MSRHVEEYLNDHGTLKHYHYPSIEDMFNQPLTENNAKRNSIVGRYSNDNKRSLGWFGVVGGYKGVIDTVEHGWEYGLRLIEQYMSEIKLPRRKSTRRRKTRSDQGNEVDIHRIFNGSFHNAWSKVVKVESFSHRKGGKRISILVNLSEPSMIEPEKAFWKGACAVMLAKTLMNHGYSIELNVLFIAHKMSVSHDYTCVSVTIKNFNQKMNLELVAAMTSVGFLRGPMFEAACKCDEIMCDNLGYPRENEAENQVLKFFENRAKMTIVVRNIRSLSDAKAFEKDIEHRLS